MVQTAINISKSLKTYYSYHLQGEKKAILFLEASGVSARYEGGNQSEKMSLKVFRICLSQKGVKQRQIFMAHITQMSHPYKGSFQNHKINSPCY